MWFYRRMLRIPWIEHVSSDKILEKMVTRRKLILNTRKRELKYQEHIMRKKGLENLILTGQIEGKEERRKTVHNILSELDGGTGFRENNKKTKFIRC